jgi:hypothetical protein
MYSVRIAIPKSPSKPDPAGLLVPIPPNAAHQRLTSMTLSEGAPPTRLTSLDGAQDAWFFPETTGTGRTIEYQFIAGDGHSPAHHFDLPDNRYTLASPELKDAIIKLTKDAADQQDALWRVIKFTTPMFDYDHPPVKFYDGRDDVPLLLCCTKGSCSDINTFLISSLRVIDVPCTYYAGYFFPAQKPPSVTGFHCWVSTLAEGRHEDWDIAQHLICGTQDVEPELNPQIPGVRLAMSYGRGLRFALPGQEVMLAHLAYPMWVFPDGSYLPSDAEATLGGPGDRIQPIVAAADVA